MNNLHGVMTGEMRPNGSKMEAIADDTRHFVKGLLANVAGSLK